MWDITFYWHDNGEHSELAAQIAERGTDQKYWLICQKTWNDTLGLVPTEDSYHSLELAMQQALYKLRMA